MLIDGKDDCGKIDERIFLYLDTYGWKTCTDAMTCKIVKSDIKYSCLLQ